MPNNRLRTFKKTDAQIFHNNGPMTNRLLIRYTNYMNDINTYKIHEVLDKMPWIAYSLIEQIYGNLLSTETKCTHIHSNIDYMIHQHSNHDSLTPITREYPKYQIIRPRDYIQKAADIYYNPSLVHLRTNIHTDS